MIFSYFEKKIDKCEKITEKPTEDSFLSHPTQPPPTTPIFAGFDHLLPLLLLSICRPPNRNPTTAISSQWKSPRKSRYLPFF